MRARQPPNLRERSRRGVVVHAKHQKVGDRGVVQAIRAVRVQSHAVERVAKNEGAAGFREIQWLDAELIACAEQLAAARVPDREDEISQKMIEAAFTPCLVCAKEQLRVGIGKICALAARPERFHELLSRIQANIGGDPRLLVESGRLTFMLWIARRG